MVSKKTALYLPVLLVLIIAVSGIFLLHTYVVFTFQIVLGLMVAPFVFRLKEKGKYSNRFLYAVIIFCALYSVLSTPLFLYLSIGCLIFYVIESFYGKIGILPFIFLLCFSPALYYFVNVFTFTLRLDMSKLASDCLQTMGYTARSHGNYFILGDGCKFNVDKACLGLNMFNTGLALTTLLIGLNEKKSGKSLPGFLVLLIFCFTAGFLVVANFIRILVVVLFRAMPGTAAHDFIGIFTLVLCMVIPVYALIYFGLKKFGKADSEVESPGELKYKSKIVFVGAVLLILFFNFFRIENESKIKIYDEKLEGMRLDGFSKVKTEDGVMEFRDAKALVYVKPAIQFLESDHPPSMCWRGSGYDVDEITERIISGRIILTAVIKKDSVTQYTAWWYDNGNIQTTDQWKIRSSKGEPFRMINITTTNEEDLYNYCRKFLKMKLF